jgi:hypothetical protein
MLLPESAPHPPRSHSCGGWRGNRRSFRSRGTRKIERLEENLGAVAIEHIGDDLREIEAAVAQIEVEGAKGTRNERYG